MTLINVVLLLVLTGIVLYFRTTIYGYNQMARVARIILNQSEPLPYSTNMTRLKEEFLKRQYQVHADNEYYKILYFNKVDNTLKIKKFKKLFLVLLIHDRKLDFFDQNLHDDIKKLEDSFSKKEFPNKYIIMAFKTYEDIKPNQMKSIGEVVSYTTGRQSYNQINVGFNQYDHKAYFLYSDKYAPNSYYKEGVDIIKSILKI